MEVFFILRFKYQFMIYIYECRHTACHFTSVSLSRSDQGRQGMHARTSLLEHCAGVRVQDEVDAAYQRTAERGWT